MKSRIMPVSNLEAKFYKSNRLTFEYNFFWFRQLGIELRHGTPYSPFELESLALMAVIYLDEFAK